MGLKAQFCHLKTVDRLDIVISDVKAKLTIYIENFNTNLWHAKCKRHPYEYLWNHHFMKMFVSFEQCIAKGFLYNIHFLTFYPFFSVTRNLSASIFLPHGMGFVDIFAVCLRSRVATWYFNLTCEVCTIFIMLVLASLALNKSCVATLTTIFLLWIEDWWLGKLLCSKKGIHFIESFVPVFKQLLVLDVL